MKRKFIHYNIRLPELGCQGMVELLKTKEILSLMHFPMIMPLFGALITCRLNINLWRKAFMTIARKLTISFYAALIFFVVSPTSQAELRSWEQSQVLQLSDDLIVASRRLYVQCRISPSVPPFNEFSSSTHMETATNNTIFFMVLILLSNCIWLKG